MKSLNSLPTVDDKFSTLVKKYVELERTSRKVSSTFKHNEKKTDLVLREKENLQQEYNKVMLGKSKLESLCRELQKLNKTIKDDSLSKIREEEEKRKETQAKFQKALNEITVMMNENNDTNKKLRDDNAEMSKKFKYILEQYELREQQVEKMNKQLDLANQLADAKYAKVQVESSVEKEIMLREKHDLLVQLEQSKVHILELRSKEKLLKQQVNMYTEKYQDFQTSISKSNQVFVGYKTEIDKMAKNMTKMEKDTTSWRTKFEKSNSALLDLASEKQVRDQHIYKTARQMHQLQKLCRMLQAERTSLLQTLKENNIECPPMPEVPPPEPEEPIPEVKQQPDHLETLLRSRDELKQNLANLQGELTVMTNAEKKENNEGAGKKKNKGKKNKKASPVEENIVPKGEKTVVKSVEEISKPIEVNGAVSEEVVNGKSTIEEVIQEKSSEVPVVVEESPKVVNEEISNEFTQENESSTQSEIKDVPVVVEEVTKVSEEISCNSKGNENCVETATTT